MIPSGYLSDIFNLCSVINVFKMIKLLTVDYYINNYDPNLSNENFQFITIKILITLIKCFL